MQTFAIATILALCIVAFLLIHVTIPSAPEPYSVEGFTVTAVDEAKMPACVGRSVAAQKLLSNILTGDDADELRLLVSKLCCLEADITTPVPGNYRTLPLQFRTSHDMEPPSTFVSSCLRNAVRARDIELVMEKYATRGRALLKKLGCDSDAEMEKNFATVLAQTQGAMTSVCLSEQPVMDKPGGVRDVGFWETSNVSGLMEYQGISARE
jgi:hypothetical protein